MAKTNAPKFPTGAIERSICPEIRQHAKKGIIIPTKLAFWIIRTQVGKARNLSPIKREKTIISKMSITRSPLLTIRNNSEL